MKILCPLLLLASLAGHAQQKMNYTISGQVIDEQGNPVVGASVMAMNQRHDANNTNRRGFYSLEIAYKPGITHSWIRVTHSSYETAQVDAGLSTVVNVVLKRKYVTDRFMYGLETNNPPVTAKVLPPPNDVQEEDKIYAKVEIDATFRGGLMRYIGKCIDSSRNLFKHNGIIVIDYSVTETGEVADVQLRQGLGTAADSVLIRCIQSTSVKWLPAIQNGRHMKTWRRLQLYLKNDIPQWIQNADTDILNKPGTREMVINPPQTKPDTLALPNDTHTRLALELLGKADITRHVKEMISKDDSKAPQPYENYLVSQFQPGERSYLYLRNFVAHELKARYTVEEMKQLIRFCETPLGAKTDLLGGIINKVFFKHSATLLGSGKE